MDADVEEDEAAGFEPDEDDDELESEEVVDDFDDDAGELLDDEPRLSLR
ncbi:hypothetical protein GCM10014713_64040 [Streptomyces purpureus]|uniref:Uncharacterized protein n=1 Tax=Streptomyces purpureus TaxID=1951 RepID=A0A918LWX3_9ACTN|nr:hypothetical protein GCM10014713_64040 [Streptomyces purpureus]